MAFTTINDGSAHFHTQLYTGNGSSGLSITNGANAGDFQPDWLWIKPRSASDNNVVFDSSRGQDRQLKPNGTDAEDTHSPARITFETDGFDLDTTDGNYNGSGTTYVAWQWIANGGTTTTNDASSTSIGTIDSVIQANTTAGFSIVTYTGNGSAGASWAHGLGAVPHWIIVKGRNLANDWAVYHHKNTSAPETDFVNLQSSDATTDSNTRWNDTAPTSTVITTGNNAAVNGNTYNYVAYCFTEIKGYSKFGSYVGNGSNEGTYVYTGFRPTWVMIKRTDSSTNGNWFIIDDQRSTGNVRLGHLRANQNNSENTSTNQSIDFLANGFKLRDANTSLNSGDYIYMAFARHPFTSSKGVPSTAV